MQMISSPLRVSRRGLLAGGALALAAPALVRAAAPARIVATTSMIADGARQIAGDLAEVQGLMGPGIDPHGFRATRSDIAAMVGADLTLSHGLLLEAQLTDFLASLDGNGRHVRVAEAIPADRLLPYDGAAGRFDPHVWMDPDLWLLAIDAIAAALAPFGDVTARADAYRAEAQAIGTYAREVLASVPEAARVLITAHDAFNYFGRAYGFEVQGLQGISTESEAGLARVSELVDLLVGRGIGAVFVESSVSDRGLTALIEGAAARGHTVVIGGQLYSDAMGPDGTWEGTWPGMIDRNATTIARALGGVAPEAGFKGLLA